MNLNDVGIAFDREFRFLEIIFAAYVQRCETHKT